MLTLKRMPNCIQLIIASLLFFTGCSTTKFMYEPSLADETIMIGTISLDAKNFEYYSNASVNGIHRAGIEITIRALDTGEKITTKSFGKHGFFYVKNPKSDRYQITRLYYKNEVSGAWASVWTSPQELIFDIKKNCVNNLGNISWVTDHKTDYDKGTAIGNYEQLKETFFMKYPESKWLSLEWIEVHSKQIQVTGIEIVDYGIYLTESTGTIIEVDEPSGAIAKQFIVKKFIKQTDRIPAELGMSFGFRFIVNGTPRGERALIVFGVSHPELVSPQISKSFKEQKYTASNTIGETGRLSSLSYKFEENWELVPGEWTLKIWYKDKLLAEKTFTVYKP